MTWTKTTSMEVFVKVIAENLLSGERKVCAVSFLTFVALDEEGKPSPVPKAIPETPEEKWLNEHAPERAVARKNGVKKAKTSKRVWCQKALGPDVSIKIYF